MNDWTAGTTYTPSSGFGSLLKRNVATDQIQGLSPAGQKGMGAFGAALTGASNQMMGKPMQQTAPPMEPEPQQGAFAPPQAPQQRQPRQMTSNGFLDYLRNNR